MQLPHNADIIYKKQCAFNLLREDLSWTNTNDTTKSPKTGDTANTMTYVVTLTLAGIVGVVAVLMRRKKY